MAKKKKKKIESGGHEEKHFKNLKKISDTLKGFLKVSEKLLERNKWTSKLQKQGNQNKEKREQPKLQKKQTFRK